MKKVSLVFISLFGMTALGQSLLLDEVQRALDRTLRDIGGAKEPAAKMAALKEFEKQIDDKRNEPQAPSDDIFLEKLYSGIGRVVDADLSPTNCEKIAAQIRLDFDPKGVHGPDLAAEDAFEILQAFCPRLGKLTKNE